MRFDDIRIPADQFITFSSGEGHWPAWFAALANQLNSQVSNDSVRWFPLSPSPVVTAIFQAAMLLAEDFSTPDVFYLQRALQDERSCLDDIESVSSKDLWDEFQRAEENPTYVISETRSTARCLTGFIQLIQVLEAFDNLLRPKKSRPNRMKHKTLMTDIYLPEPLETS